MSVIGSIFVNAFVYSTEYGIVGIVVIAKVCLHSSVGIVGIVGGASRRGNTQCPGSVLAIPVMRNIQNRHM